eukprot:gene26893-35588_t
MGGQWYDALVAIPGCDKNMPGCLIAMGRLNRPALMVYGGTIRAGCTEKFPQVLGGSTNAVLHLIAMARSVGVPLTLDDFQEISNRTPFLADLKPSGKYLLDNNMLHGDCLTVTGKTMAENLALVKPVEVGNGIIFPLENPIKETGHLQILYGNLAPDGSVAKITGKEGLVFSGVAKVYDSEELMMQGLNRKEITKGMVVIIRYEGPKGGPGMPEMLTPTSAIMGAGLGGSHGFIIGHVTPEAQVGGPIALVEDGDAIVIDAEKKTISVNLTSQELETRRAKWTAPPLKATRGTLFKYIKNVASASLGCVTDE